MHTVAGAIHVSGRILVLCRQVVVIFFGENTEENKNDLSVLKFKISFRVEG